MVEKIQTTSFVLGLVLIMAGVGWLLVSIRQGMISIGIGTAFFLVSVLIAVLRGNPTYPYKIPYRPDQ